jgi:AcrR family transcriptional regulator
VTPSSPRKGRARPGTPYDEAMSRKVEQGEATRGKLVDVAIALFTADGYAGASTTEIVRRAAVTRGALYHHFADKEELFRAAYEAVERDIFHRCRAAAQGREGTDALKEGIAAYLDACLENQVQRILLTEGPLVLGWDRSLRFDDPYCARRLLRASVDRLTDGPPEPLAHLLFGALLQAGLVIADAPERREEMGTAMAALVDSLFEKDRTFS